MSVNQTNQTYQANQTAEADMPKTTVELLKYIIKKIPERVLKALPMTIAIGVGSWLLHTFLLVYTNEGFNPGTWLGNNFLNVKGRVISSTLLWAMIGGIIPLAISFFARKGNPVKSIVAMAKIPTDIIKKSKTSHGSFLPLILFSCSAALLFDKVLSGVSGLVAGGIIMSSVVAFITGRGSIFIQIFRMAFNDIQTFVIKKKSHKLDGESVYLIMGSSGIALLAYGLIKTLNVFPLIFGTLGRIIPFMAGFFNIVLIGVLFIFNSVWLILLVLGIILMTQNKSVPKQLLFIGGFFLAMLAADSLIGITIFADDGGWREAGGTLGGWLTSQGFVPAVLSGVLPAAGGLIGSYVSSILSGIMNGFGPLDFGPDDGGGQVPTTPDVPTQGVTPTDPNAPVDPSTVAPPSTDKPPLTADEIKKQEEEKARLEQERLRKQQEFEAKKQQEMERQRLLREKALADLERIKAEREAKRLYIEGLCRKYNTTPDKLRSVIRGNQAESEADAAKWLAEERKWATAEAAATIVLVGADTAIDGLANMTGPYGRGIRAGYKVIKGSASSMAENGVSVKSALSGAATGGADAATDFVDHPGAKAAITIAGETLGGAIQNGAAGAKDGLIKGVYGAGSNFASDKLGGKGYGNDMVQTFNKNGTATVAINSGGKWITKTLTGESALKFANKKIGQQLTQSAIKGTFGLGNELVAKPSLQNAGYLPK